jgi:hypothetical protein
VVSVLARVPAIDLSRLPCAAALPRCWVAEGLPHERGAVAQVSPRPDVLTLDEAQFRTGKGEWRLSGTASITTGNQVTVWIGGTPGTGTRVGTPATVDALGVWSIRLPNGPNPGAVRVISVTSSRGGSLAGAPLVVRN